MIKEQARDEFEQQLKRLLHDRASKLVMEYWIPWKKLSKQVRQDFKRLLDGGHFNGKERVSYPGFIFSRVLAKTFFSTMVTVLEKKQVLAAREAGDLRREGLVFLDWHPRQYPRHYWSGSCAALVLNLSRDRAGKSTGVEQLAGTLSVSYSSITANLPVIEAALEQFTVPGVVKGK